MALFFACNSNYGIHLMAFPLKSDYGILRLIPQ